ncbi:MAG: hypothetical protein NT018_10470 [Armatimonadetes bacterium]|nr:hypothetical protein [Armatimonadota bacterium]
MTRDEKNAMNGVTKREAPYIAHPIVSWVSLLGITFTFIATWINYLEMRPGLLELGIGFVFAIVFSHLPYQMFLVILSRLALIAKEEPSVKWISLVLGIFTGAGAGAVLLVAITLVLLTIGACCVNALVGYVWQVDSHSKGSIVGFVLKHVNRAESRTISLRSAAYVYFLTFAALGWLRTLRWYYRLPD